MLLVLVLAAFVQLTTECIVVLIGRATYATQLIIATLFAGLLSIAPVASSAQQSVEQLEVLQNHLITAVPQERISKERFAMAQCKATILIAESTSSQLKPPQKNDLTPMPYPQDGHFSISLMQGGTEIVFAGDVAHGVAKQLSEFLDQAPEVRVIGFYSGGGRISEAETIRGLIRARKLDTYVYKQCLSACTIAFTGGRNRYIEPDGQLGFHSSSVPDRIEFDNNRDRDRNLIEDAISAGIDASFAVKAFNTPSVDMWFPSIAELIQAGVVTNIANGRFSTSAIATHRYAVDPLEIAISALERGDYKNTVRLFRPFADQGDAFAQFILGFMYNSGNGVPQDHEEAATWYRLAAEQGYATAQNNLGIAYSKGQGVPQDEAQAVTWFRKAAEQGELRAQTNLARRYYQGIGVPQNYRDAAKWYQLAAKQGDASAQNQLGFMYSVGQGVPQNYVMAHLWLNLAASRLPAGTKGRAWAVENRDRLVAKMTPAEIAEAERLAREWRSK